MRALDKYLDRMNKGRENKAYMREAMTLRQVTPKREDFKTSAASRSRSNKSIKGQAGGAGADGGLKSARSSYTSTQGQQNNPFGRPGLPATPADHITNININAAFNRDSTFSMGDISNS